MTQSRPQRRRRVTRAEVAEAAGTSVAVVSYVMNRGPRPVAAETRKRVLKAVRDLGYRPNTVARSLALGKSGTLGLLVPDISNTFFAAMAHRLAQEFNERDKVLLLADAADSLTQERKLLETFLQQQIDGLVYIGVREYAFIDEIVEAGVQVVVLDRIPGHNGLSSVTVDNKVAAMDATRHLARHGRTRIGIIEGPAQISTARARAEGWEEALHEAGLTIMEEWRTRKPFTKRGGYEGALDVFRGDRVPDALFISSEQQAIGALKAAEEMGLAVPADVAIFTFDGTTASEDSRPSLSTVVQPLEEMAKRVAELLTASNVVNQNIVCDYSLEFRTSCGCSGHTSNWK